MKSVGTHKRTHGSKGENSPYRNSTGVWDPGFWENCWGVWFTSREKHPKVSRGALGSLGGSSLSTLGLSGQPPSWQWPHASLISSISKHGRAGAGPADAQEALVGQAFLHKGLPLSRWPRPGGPSHPSSQPGPAQGFPPSSRRPTQGIPSHPTPSIPRQQASLGEGTKLPPGCAHPSTVHQAGNQLLHGSFPLVRDSKHMMSCKRLASFSV